METEEIDLKSILAIFKRQRRLLALTLVLVIGLALVYLVAAVPVFRSTVLLQVDGKTSNLLDPTGAGNEQSAILNSRVDSEVEILRSDATALAVVQAASLIEDPEFGPQLSWSQKLLLAFGGDPQTFSFRQMIGIQPAPPPSQESLVNGTLRSLQAAVDVRRRGLTYLIAISVSSENPARAAEIANIYAETYIKRQVAAKTQATVDARDVLRRQIETAQADLAASEEAVNTFIEENLSQLELQSGDPVIADLRRRLNEAKSAQADVAGRLVTAETAIAAQDWTTVADTLGDQALAELARQQVDLERRLKTLAEGSAEALDLEAALTQLDSELERSSNATLKEVREAAAATRERESETRDALRTQLLQSDLSAEILAELFNLQQSATVARNQYQTLLAREQDLGALANLQIADARVVSEALAPSNPSSPNRRLILAIAVVGGLAIGMMLALLKEYFIGGIVSASQLANVMQAPVPVTVPILEAGKSGADPAEAIVLSPMSSFAESFRKLRATIDLGMSRKREGQDKQPRAQILLVCSALQAEGKTSTAIALARTYALSGARTLLIEADLRRPAISARLAMEDTNGLIDFLSALPEDEGTQITTGSDKISPLLVIPAGARSTVPTDQLLNSASFRALLDVVSSNVDIAIIDSPPLLPVVDARYLAGYADAVVQVVRYGTTTQGEVREASHLLRDAMKPTTFYMGVLNLEERATHRYGYYGNYGYYGEDAG